jgi:hypothetical protein
MGIENGDRGRFARCRQPGGITERPGFRNPARRARTFRAAFGRRLHTPDTNDLGPTHPARARRRPIIAGLRSPRLDRKPAAWTPVDRDYEALRIDMQNLFTHLGITSINAAAAA